MWRVWRMRILKKRHKTWLTLLHSNQVGIRLQHSQAGIHIIPSNTILNVERLIIGAKINHVVIVNNWKYEVVEKIPYCRIYTEVQYMYKKKLPKFTITQKVYFHDPKCTFNADPVWDQKWKYNKKRCNEIFKQSRMTSLVSRWYRSNPFLLYSTII